MLIRLSRKTELLEHDIDECRESKSEHASDYLVERHEIATLVDRSPVVWEKGEKPRDFTVERHEESEQCSRAYKRPRELRSERILCLQPISTLDIEMEPDE